MSRSHLMLLSVLVLIVHSHPIMAATFYVGNCHSPSYSTIQDAVNAVAPGSVIKVCPGTYAEQVTISHALTLQGVRFGNSSQVMITPISPPALTTSIFSNLVEKYLPVNAQVRVTAGPVTIKNITVDGTGGANGCAYFFVGVFYASGSSGMMDEVLARYQTSGNQGCGIGILVENGAGASQSVTIQNSTVQDVDGYGIATASDQTPPTLTATVKGNEVTSKYIGTIVYSNLGTLTGNKITGYSYGVMDDAPSMSVSANTVTNSSFGISADKVGDQITSNTLLNDNFGIYLAASDATTTVQSNTIINSGIGIVFNCLTANVTHNTIKDTFDGLQDVPSSFNGVNTFYNVPTIVYSVC